MGLPHPLLFARLPQQFERQVRHRAHECPDSGRTPAGSPPVPTGSSIIRIAAPPLALLCVAAWMLAHPYQGIFHDANLYTLQALAHLHPALAQDVFLRFGSQDRFTAFSPIYAAAIRMLGPDHAAALLTLTSQVALIAAGWYLARNVIPSRPSALLGVAMLIVIPGNYGPDRVFAVIEPFLTPRMGAEACTAAGIAAALSGRRLWSGALLIAGLSLHPVMAAAGVVLLFIHYVALPHPGIAAPVVKLGIIGLLVAAFALPAGEWGRLGPDWLALVSERSPYLFLSHWTLDDCGRAGVVLTTLIVGSFGRKSPLRRLCLSAALTLLAGIALTGLGCDVLHVTLITQMQPWRWEWLATLVAALNLPFIVITHWQRGAPGRSTGLLLLAAWIFGVGAFALITCLTALMSLSFARLKPRELRLVFWGSCAVMALALTWRIASNLEFAEFHGMDDSLPVWLRRCMSFVHDGFAPALLIGIAAWIIVKRRALAASWICTALAIAAIGAVWPWTWKSWNREEFPRPLAAKFALWQDVIAPGDEVLWSESPLSSWVLLHRPNYLSGIQTAGLVFSRESALEFARRADALAGVLDPATFLVWNHAGAHLSLTPEALERLCRLRVFAYLVTGADLAQQPVAVINHLKLYACAAAAAT